MILARRSKALGGANFATERIKKGPVCGIKKPHICTRTRTGKGAQLEIDQGLRTHFGDGPGRRLETFARAVRDSLFARLESWPPSTAT